MFTPAVEATLSADAVLAQTKASGTVLVYPAISVLELQVQQAALGM
jgi:hypothetical protein